MTTESGESPRADITTKTTNEEPDEEVKRVARFAEQLERLLQLDGFDLYEQLNPLIDARIAAAVNLDESIHRNWVLRALEERTERIEEITRGEPP